MKKWEYKHMGHGNIVQSNELNELGLEGWELCANGNGYFIFKREIQEPKVEQQEEKPFVMTKSGKCYF